MSLFRKPLVAGCWVAVVLAVGCNNEDLVRNKSHENIPVASIKAGKELAVKYCQSCHLLPNPTWASSKYWETRILPNMGPRLGIFAFGGKHYPSFKFDISISPNFYPDKPLMNQEEWSHIIDYYTSLSPDSLSTDQHRTRKIQMDLQQFTVMAPALVPNATPVSSLVKFDTADTRFPIIAADALSNKLYRYDKQLVPGDSIDTRSPVVGLERLDDGWITCNIGMLNPSNGSSGTAAVLKTTMASKVSISFLNTLNNLKRPVLVKPADLNNDGKRDFLVCEFGYQEGEFVWYENMDNKTYYKHVLRGLPGAIAAYLTDYNHDGLTDIWALFAQGEEGIFLYTNKGNGRFEEQEILRFPPINGSSYFELVDFNKDGFADILYTCGDNADYSTELKPYHGVYIFLNDGQNKFTQRYFYPINGCYKAVASDFDKDGDLDIATIAHFADFKRQPEEGFVYFENKGGFDFVPHSSNKIFCGRWLTMDVGDMDKDGYNDIILGNFSVAPSFIPPTIDWKKGPAFLVLKNVGSQTK